MDRLYITRYYPQGTDPRKNIMRLPREDSFRLAAELAEKHPDLKGFRRFADFQNYYPLRESTEGYLREKFTEADGKPELKHPYYFVLMESEDLHRSLGDGEALRIYLDELPDDVISFTIGDSCALYASNEEFPLLTKQMLLDGIQSHGGSVRRYMDDVLGDNNYIEAQLWAEPK